MSFSLRKAKKKEMTMKKSIVRRDEDEYVCDTMPDCILIIRGCIIIREVSFLKYIKQRRSKSSMPSIQISNC